MSEPKRAAIYARVSTRDQEATNQLLELRAFCDRKGWDVANEYIDHESGGKADRIAFQHMFQEASQARFDVVVFWALDRFSREGVFETLSHLRRLEDAGVGFRSYTEEYLDSTGMFKDAVLAVLAAVAKQERARLSERVKAGLARARSQGKRLGRPGVSHAKLAAMRELYESGAGVRAIARELRVAPATVSKYLGSRESDASSPGG